jgi:hypothetical protein
VLAEMADPSTELTRQAAAAGIDPADLGTEATVTDPAAGFDPITILIVVLTSAGTGVGKGLATRAWDEILGPAIKDRLGIDSIGKRKDDR